MDIKNFVTDTLKSIIKSDFFIVDVKIGNDNKISVKIDNEKGILLSECKKIHKELYSLIENKIEYFELEVSSPGLTSSLKVWQQYKKLINNSIEIQTVDNQIFKAIVENADENLVSLILNENNHINIEYNKIKKAKQIIEF